MVTLRQMHCGDLATVSALGIRSKASWGYDESEMEVFSGELSLDENSVADLLDAQVAVGAGGEIVGYFTLRAHDGGAVELEHLFVDPDHFRLGIGRQLLAAAEKAAADAGATGLTIICDPNSTGFYTKHGADIVGKHQSSIAGREIPVLRLCVGGEPDP